ncbi:transglycosylase domain-containing protein [Formosa algae]|uniref:Penicillin-binding protein 1A n=1 Tax=Formosa algae TaxID=225843 RepID=A0A9X0YHH6_9FLAO|nr:transglycosylase domain-containing protein [Formosa algae]MBP1838315.1 penicillin-binding protein 1A [Formosa algae]MDQ0334450.1 penicillin-binding protein 1A [Formosa algae]OEI82149.1 penicillin-binding protein [Formosa algae]
MKKQTKLKKRSWLGILIKLVLFGALLVLLFIGSIYLEVWGKIPSKTELSDLKQAEASLILDRNEDLLGKYFVFDRSIIEFKDIPKYLVNGLVATEDARFYEHEGIDYKSFFRVFFKSVLLQDDSAGGGSTITQQLAKNLYGRKNHGLFSMPVNKISEMIIASRIEAIYDKDDIIALYLNTVPFSENTFGIESAAQRFFNTTTSNLSLSEASTLVGSLKANHSYNPRLFPERSQFRRDVVLQQMEKYGYIDEATRLKESNTPIEIDYHKFTYNEGLAPYFREQVRKQVSQVLDSINSADDTEYDLYTDGLKITTTLDNTMQEYAEQGMISHMERLQTQFENAYGAHAPWLKNDELIQEVVQKLPEYKRLQAKKLSEAQIMDSLRKKSKKPLFTYEGDTIMSISTIDSLKHYLKFLNAGFVAIEPQTGAVRAYVGGVNFEHFKYDHISMGKRQVGSTFKPFVYTAALESGLEPCAYFSVKEITYTDEEGWTPSNASDGEDDPYMNYSLETALSRSINTIAVKVLEQVGIQPVIDQARKMGVVSDLPEVPSLALGTAELSLMELTSAYTSYVNESVPSRPYFIEKIEDKDGRVLYGYKPSTPLDAAYSEQTRETMIEFMKATINEGTAKRIRSTYGLSNDMAGKTGTTQDNRDGWFMSITPNLVMGSWVGNDDHRIGFSSTGIGQGANSALPIVANFVSRLNNNNDFNSITQAKFKTPSDDVLEALDCDPDKRDGFFKRLFGKKKKEKAFGE